jgi:hypothetical protein
MASGDQDDQVATEINPIPNNIATMGINLSAINFLQIWVNPITIKTAGNP